MFTLYEGYGKGEAACTVLYSCVGYVTSQQGRVSEVRYQQSLVGWAIQIGLFKEEEVYT
jgi:hypothetical protein